MKKNVLCVIPARAGSKGLAGKNLMLLNGRPLISYVIETACKVQAIDKVVVSTDSEDIAKAAISRGAEAPFLRPAGIAQDYTPLFPVLIHAIKYYDSLNWPAHIIISLQPTSPLTAPEDIDRGIKMILETNCDSVSSVCKIEQFHPFRALRLTDDNKVFPLTEYTSEKAANRQDRPAAFGHNGAFYIRKREVLEQWSGSDFAFGKDPRAVIMDKVRSINIDTILEFKLAEVILKERLHEKH